MDLLEHIEKDLNKGKRVNIILGVTTFGIAITILFLPFSEDEKYKVYGFSAFIFILSLGSLITAYRKQPKNNKLYKAITQNPDDIRRVYPQHNFMNGLHHATVLVFVMKDSDVVMIQIPKGEDDQWIAKVKEFVSNAEYGFVDVLKKQ